MDGRFGELLDARLRLVELVCDGRALFRGHAISLAPGGDHTGPSHARVHNPAVRVALLQMDLAWEDWQANHARAAKLLKRAADGGANLALLPEMFATGFSMDGAKIAQPPGGPTEQWLRGDGARARAAPHRGPRRDVRRRRGAVGAAAKQRALGLARRRRRALHEAPPLLLRGRGREIRGRRERRDVDDRRRARDAAGLLRPALPGALPPRGGRDRPLRGRRELARAQARALAAPPEGARDRESLLRRRRQPRGRRRQRLPSRGRLGRDLAVGRDARERRRDRDRPPRRRRSRGGGGRTGEVPGARRTGSRAATAAERRLAARASGRCPRHRPLP